MYRTGRGTSSIDDDLLERCRQLFKDPFLSQNTKDAFFVSLMTAYIKYRNVANPNEKPSQF